MNYQLIRLEFISVVIQYQIAGNSSLRTVSVGIMLGGTMVDLRPDGRVL